MDVQGKDKTKSYINLHGMTTTNTRIPSASRVNKKIPLIRCERYNGGHHIVRPINGIDIIQQNTDSDISQPNNDNTMTQSNDVAEVLPPNNVTGVVIEIEDSDSGTVTPYASPLGSMGTIDELANRATPQTTPPRTPTPPVAPIPEDWDSTSDDETPRVEIADATATSNGQEIDVSLVDQNLSLPLALRKERRGNREPDRFHPYR